MEGITQATPPLTRNPRSYWIFGTAILILLLVLLVEAGSRAILSIPPLRRRAVGIDNVSYRLQWIQLRGQKLEWTGPFAGYHPVLGWVLKPNIRNLHVFDGTVLNSNSRGIRGLTEYPYERSAAHPRMVVLGDSFTFGSEVADEDTFSHVLESSIPGAEVINLGVQGYGHDQMLLYLQREGIKYRPDIVMVGFTYIDVYRNIQNFFAYAKPQFIPASGGLRLLNVPVPAPDRVLAEEARRPKALDLSEIFWQKLRWSLGMNEADARTVTRMLLEEIAKTARRAGAQPVFVYMPVLEEIAPVPIYGVTAKTPPVSERERFLRGVCQEAKVPCLFLGDQFRAQAKRGANLNPEHHWNKLAHSLGAQAMREFLMRQNLLAARNQVWSLPEKLSGAF
jgi:hypothetical protein